MAWPVSAFPTGLDSITDKTDSVDTVVADDLNGAYDCIEHLEVKVGIDSSAVATSLDYLLKNTSSSNPGHKHTLADGATDVTASAAELNLIDGSSAGTAVASKALVLGSDKNIDTIAIADGGLKLGAGAGTAVTSTAAELNLLDDAVAGTVVASKAIIAGASKEIDMLTIAALTAGTQNLTGGQITFPATQAASAGANVLDDYEEAAISGTPTAEIGTMSSASFSGAYTKIGRAVFICVTVTITSVGTGSEAILVAMPFAAASVGVLAGRENAIGGSMAQGYVTGSSCVIRDYKNSSLIQAGNVISLSGVYFAAT